MAIFYIIKPGKYQFFRTPRKPLESTYQVWSSPAWRMVLNDRYVPFPEKLHCGKPNI